MPVLQETCSLCGRRRSMGRFDTDMNINADGFGKRTFYCRGGCTDSETISWPEALIITGILLVFVALVIAVIVAGGG